jgi:hypothetical protein
MEIPHISAIIVFAFSVSIVFALTSKETFKERIRYGLYVFFCFLGVALGLAWLMFFFPR